MENSEKKEVKEGNMEMKKFALSPPQANTSWI